MVAELGSYRADDFADIRTENDFIEFLDHLARAEFSEVTALATRGALTVGFGQLGEIFAPGNLGFQIVACLFGRNEDMTRAGPAHNVVSLVKLPGKPGRSSHTLCGRARLSASFNADTNIGASGIPCLPRNQPLNYGRAGVAVPGPGEREYRMPHPVAGNGVHCMSNVVAIVGSLRKQSFNRALLNAAIELAPPGLALREGKIEGIPLYDADLEAVDIPVAVEALKGRVAAADGILLFTPEYNGSFPGVLKNVIDWVSRPPQDQDKVLRGKPVGLLGATPGGMGTAYAQSAWLPVFRALGLSPWFGGSFHLSRAHKALDESGRLVDQDMRDRLEAYLADFDAFVRGV